MALPENENGQEQDGPVIRDRRRIDPDTGELRTPEEAEESAADSGEPEVAVTDDAELLEVRQQLEERTSDLKRLQAEFTNYRRRVDRDRAAVQEQAVAQVVSELLPILDDIGRAREHDELNGGFKSVGEALEALVTKLGLKKYAEKGDEFDPNVHEALTMVPSPEVTTPAVMEVFQPGYLIGERVLRPARVVVAGPVEEEPGEESDPSAAGAAGGEPAGPDSSAETGTGTSEADSDEQR